MNIDKINGENSTRNEYNEERISTIKRTVDHDVERRVNHINNFKNRASPDYFTSLGLKKKKLKYIMNVMQVK
jgi:hypothetical protein